MAVSSTPASDISNLLDQATLKYLFVGGKGGVGKTTCSCSIAIQLAQRGRKVLLISTDPAHNLSDAFNQRLGAHPVAVNSVDRLFAMEVDPAQGLKETVASAAANAANAEGQLPEAFATILQSMNMSMPGFDEVASLMQIMSFTERAEYDVLVFDTAPTGHTLRLLELPDNMLQMVDKIMSLDANMGGILTRLGNMMGGGENMLGKVEAIKRQVEQLKKVFSDPDRTTFVCVCIAEFLSIYETERLIQDLTRLDFDCRNIIVNQLVIPDPGKPCAMCSARAAVQNKYLTQVDDLYDDFHVIKVPLQPGEVRGPDALSQFSTLLLPK